MATKINPSSVNWDDYKSIWRMTLNNPSDSSTRYRWDFENHGITGKFKDGKENYLIRIISEAGDQVFKCDELMNGDTKYQWCIEDGTVKDLFIEMVKDTSTGYVAQRKDHTGNPNFPQPTPLNNGTTLDIYVLRDKPIPVEKGERSAIIKFSREVTVKVIHNFDTGVNTVEEV